MDVQIQETDAPSNTAGSKAPIVRGARACTVCRQAKMKCVGSEDGTRPCQRCRRSNVECVFEKHRRGRKPGSKLSEASKMLRRLEKNLSGAKSKSQTETAVSAPYPAAESQTSPSDVTHYTGTIRAESYAYNAQFSSLELAPLKLAPSYDGDGSLSNPGSRGTLDEEDDPDQAEDTMFPGPMIKKESRHSFFNTILNPPAEHEPLSPAVRPVPAPLPEGFHDPITAGLISEQGADSIFDMIWLRLNPFINLFDPALHNVAYVRSKCPFLFSVLMMAGAKFFKPEIFRDCLKIANDLAVQAFAHGWKRVEVVQAFACLTYWKEPDDNRTWTYIGYACRMAVELNLNRYHAKPPPHETPRQLLERRNRERTYLVLWVHDRSLSMQTGRHWMLPEDELVLNSDSWHEKAGASIRPEDVILAAQVNLRRLAAETTEIFYSSTGRSGRVPNDVNYEMVLGNCNRRLTDQAAKWNAEMDRAHGDKFHISFLNMFRLNVRLFLNSFGIRSSMAPSSRIRPSPQALSACYQCAKELLKIVSEDFYHVSMLRYGQDSITIMSAYAAVFLLRLLNNSTTLSGMPESAAQDIHSLITRTADAYFDISSGSPSTSALYHARFLRNLVDKEVFRTREGMEQGREDRFTIDPGLQDSHSSQSPQMHESPQDIYPQPMVQGQQHAFHFPASPVIPQLPELSQHDYVVNVKPRDSGQPMNTYWSAHPNSQGAQPSEMDAHYWRNIFRDLGFGAEQDPTIGTQPTYSNVRGAIYPESQLPPPPPQPMSYHMSAPQQNGSY